MLGQRIVTAAVLLALLIPALFARATWPFATLTLVLIAAAGWEWGRLNQVPGVGAVAMGLTVAVACLAVWQAGWIDSAPAGVWWIAAAAWVVGGGAALRAGVVAWPHHARALRWAIGVLVLWAAWIALGVARGIGIAFVLSVFCLVWVADIAAYFGGRTFGRHKLAPTISPGKTWEGVWTAMVAVVVLAVAWHAASARWPALAPNLYSDLAQHLGWPLAVAALLALTGMSVVGDLFESLVKRAAGAKDSSRLLPGHGGVLDRVDALLPVFPIALALHSMR
jgi:phosphatidate cytidylyltransferase